jgi:septum formation inhibitor-activating ATPase MinD
MIIRKLNIGETIKLFSNENGFACGDNTVIKALVPEASYDMTCAGEFIIDRWDSIYPQPTSQEIRDEYIRQQTIAEVIDYLKSKDFDLIKFICDNKL